MQKNDNSLGLGEEWAITEQIEVLSECFSDVLSAYERFFVKNGISLREQGHEAVKVYKSLSDDSRTLMLCHSLNEVGIYRKKLQAGREYIRSKIDTGTPENPGLRAMKKASQIAEEYGISEISLDEINEEVNSHRVESGAVELHEQLEREMDGVKSGCIKSFDQVIDPFSPSAGEKKLLEENKERVRSKNLGWKKF